MTLFESCESVFAGNHFRIRQKLFTLPWREYCVEHRSGIRLGFARRKRRRLFDLIDIRIYSDETVSTELLSIKQRSFFEWATNYDVVDSTTGQPVGLIRRSSLASFAYREWFVIDALGQELGTIRRKYSLGLFTPQYFFLEFGNNEIGTAVLSPGFFKPTMSLDLSAVPAEKLDRRLAIAFGLIALATDTWS